VQIEIRKNQIVIEFSEEESHFIKQKVGSPEAENMSNYIKGKLIKALSLEDLEKDGSANVGKDFNLNKIKNVTAELKKSNFKSDKTPGTNNNVSKEGIPADAGSTQKEELTAIPESDTSESDAADEIAAEIGDELLSDLLDKDLLKSRQKLKKDSES
jgi:hypothetical protein